LNLPFLDLKRQYRIIQIDVERALSEVFKKQTWILGEEVKLLEEKVARYLGTNYAVGVNSGTDALVIALRALALKTKGKQYFEPENEIITPSFTFTATGEAIVRAGATPVFVDIEPKTFNLNPEEVKKAINKNTVGLLPVHLYGQPANMEQIVEIARENSLFVVEDVAQAFGSKWDGKFAGSIGDAGCHSFFPSKNLGGFGDGGMITTNDAEIADYARWLRAHGGKDKYNVDYIGYNSRLDTIQAAFLLVKLNYLETFIKMRRELAAYYHENLKGIDQIVLPLEERKAFHTYNQYTIRVKNKRDWFQEKLKEKGIPTMIYYPVPLHKMKVFKNKARIKTELRETEKACREVLSLPIEPLLNNTEKKEIIRAIKESVKILPTN
jgi:dTDP-4-amino-4,6-dideoxygalactose transaminase